jgi:energy-dependent translational throttle protein EttA
MAVVPDPNYTTWQLRLVLNASYHCACHNQRPVVWFEGNFKEYDADLRRRKGADADTPHRVTYKKLVRS